MKKTNRKETLKIWLGALLLPFVILAETVQKGYRKLGTLPKRAVTLCVALAVLVSMAPMVAFATDDHTDHCICGTVHESVGEHTAKAEIDFVGVSTYDALVAAATNGGSVFLENDIAITNVDTVTVAEGKTLTLCLNGKKLSYAGPGTATIIKVAEGATLNITDCGTNTREGHIDATTKLWTEGSGNSSDNVAYNLVGGVITGGKGHTSSNWGTYHAGAIMNKGTVFIYGGNIAGNQAIDTNGGDGGAIFNATGSNLYVYGGAIVGNYANDSIVLNYEENDVVFTGDAVFAYNTLTNNYSLIKSSYGNGSVEISGNASFSHNRGGNVVYSYYEPLVVKDNASFADNQVIRVINYSYDILEEGKGFYLDGNILMERNINQDNGLSAVDLFVDYTYMPDVLITLTAPLTRNYSVELPWFLEGGVLAKGDGTNVAKLTAADAEKFTEVDGRAIAAANDVVYVGRVILDQPTKDNDYTVTATDDPTYQWQVITKETYKVTDEEASWTVGSYDSDTGKWYATGFYDGWYFNLELYAGDVITLVFDDAVNGNVEVASYLGEAVLTPGEGNTYTYTALFDGDFAVRVDDGSSNATYPAVTASVNGKVFIDVNGQTDAKLNTENLKDGVYTCKVIWPAEDEYDDPYVLMSDTVEYHAHKYTYTVSGNVITEKCTCGHEETATITAPAQGSETATVTYSDNWQGGALTLSYGSGSNANEQSASASIGGVTVTVTFTKAPAETPKPELNGSDNHGDGFDPGLWVSVMTVSAMAMAVLLIGKKKEIF